MKKSFCQFLRNILVLAVRLEQIGNLKWNEIKVIMSYYYKTVDFVTKFNEIMIQELKVKYLFFFFSFKYQQIFKINLNL